MKISTKKIEVLCLSRCPKALYCAS